MAEASGPDVSGSVVAFEGLPETISTQLRLLPTSSQILILPSVQCYLPVEDADRKFEPHAFIRKAHEAVKARDKTARTFLRASATTGRRLVFLSGGTPSAQALCIRQIMRHETQGDYTEAEAMFHFLVKEGLAGLDSQAKKWQTDKTHSGSRTTSRSSSRTQPQQQQNVPQRSDKSDEDPTTRAMRAAEALDLQTASLQPSNELDLTASSRPRSSSLPMYGYSDNFGDAAPFFVFGAQRRPSTFSIAGTMDDCSAIPATPGISVTRYDEESISQPAFTGFTDLQPSPSCVGETYCPTFLHSPRFDAFSTTMFDNLEAQSPKATTGDEMRIPAIRTSLTRVRSLDRIYSASPVHRDLCIPSADTEKNSEGLGRPHSCMVKSDETELARRPSFLDGTRTIAVRPQQQAKIVQLSPVPAEKRRKQSCSSYVDRGTDAGGALGQLEPFSPVLPITEDLVIYLRDEVPDGLLENVIRSFKEGVFPVLSNSLEGSETDTVNDQLPSTPPSQSIHDSDGSTEATADDEESAIVAPLVEIDEYDPYAYIQGAWPPTKPLKTVTTVKVVERPPTPEETPIAFLSEDDREEKFHDFNVVESLSPVAVQNSLRSVLRIYFPPETQGPRHFSFGLLPELETLWEPIFREAEPGSPRANKRRMDQILAVGSQRSVKKEFSSSVVGLLEKLGTKQSGMSRSGRLDFR